MLAAGLEGEETRPEGGALPAASPGAWIWVLCTKPGPVGRGLAVLAAQRAQRTFCSTRMIVAVRSSDSLCARRGSQPSGVHPSRSECGSGRTTVHRRTRLLGAAAAAAAALTLIPRVVHAADDLHTPAAIAADTVWVVVAACFVLFMQAGFAMLEVGFSRMKNVGTVVAKIVVNLSISSIVYWVVGFAIAFGGASGILGAIIGHTGFVPQFRPGSHIDTPSLDGSTVSASAKFFFEFVFCAVSLAIVWGTMLERTKFIVYILFAVPFSGFIYPMISHWLFGGGWLMTHFGAQDFAGSTVVHLTGATAGFAGLLLLGPRIGKYSRDGEPNAIPGD